MSKTKLDRTYPIKIIKCHSFYVTFGIKIRVSFFEFRLLLSLVALYYSSLPRTVRECGNRQWNRKQTKKTFTDIITKDYTDELMKTKRLLTLIVSLLVLQHINTFKAKKKTEKMCQEVVAKSMLKVVYDPKNPKSPILRENIKKVFNGMDSKHSIFVMFILHTA